MTGTPIHTWLRGTVIYVHTTVMTMVARRTVTFVAQRTLRVVTNTVLRASMERIIYGRLHKFVCSLYHYNEYKYVNYSL